MQSQREDDSMSGQLPHLYAQRQSMQPQQGIDVPQTQGGGQIGYSWPSHGSPSQTIGVVGRSYSMDGVPADASYGAGLAGQSYGGPSDAEIDVILSNYKPVAGTTSFGQSGAHAQAMDMNMGIGMSGGRAPPGGNLDPATAAAAAAAYGHLGFGGSGRSSAVGQEASQPGLPVNMSLAGGGVMAVQDSLTDVDWSAMSMAGHLPPQGSNSNSNPQPTSAEGELSSSTLTPGSGSQSGGSEGTSETGIKRRRLTFNGVPPKAPTTAHVPGRRSLTEMSSLDRSAFNLMGTGDPVGTDNNDANVRYHRRSLSSSHPQLESNSWRSEPSTTVPRNAMGGHAASHPPGLGGQILRGQGVSGTNAAAAASDFTKRKGWAGRIVEELQDFVHVIDPEGKVLYASPSVQELTGWKSEDLKGRVFTEFIHPDDVPSVLREFKRLREGQSELLMYYRFRAKPQASGSPDNQNSGKRKAPQKGMAHDETGNYVVFEASGHAYFPPDGVAVPANGSCAGDSKAALPGELGQAEQEVNIALASGSGAAGGQEAKCFFCTSRLYPSKNISMLDSFLELKIENEKLRILLSDMDSNSADGDPSMDQADAPVEPGLQRGPMELDTPVHLRRSSFPPASLLDQSGSGPSELGHQGSPRSATALHGFTSRDVMQLGSMAGSPVSGSIGAPYPTSSIQGMGVSRPGTSSDLPADDSDDAASNSGVGGTDDGKRKKKKSKADDGDYVCTDCGRVDSPEWRKGPLGPKTLCNACGLRWAKKIKRKGVDPTTVGVGGQPLSPTMGNAHAFGEGPNSSGYNLGPDLSGQ